MMAGNRRETPREESSMPGQIVHTEILVDDEEAALGLLGGAYRLRFLDCAARGGVPPCRGSARRAGLRSPEWSPVAAARARTSTSTDIDAGVARVRELGGEADDKQTRPLDGLVRDVPRPARQRLRALAVGRQRVDARVAARPPRRNRPTGSRGALAPELPRDGRHLARPRRVRRRTAAPRPPSSHCSTATRPRLR